MSILTWKEKFSQSPILRQRMMATTDCLEGYQPLPGMSSLLVVQCRMVNPEIIYTETTKTESFGWNYVFVK